MAETQTDSIAASAPGRCGIVGNPSDMYGGFVVSCSIPRRNYCRVSRNGATAQPDDGRLWRAATRRFPLPNGSPSLRSEVPHSSGLAGSTAMLAAMLACVAELRGESRAFDAEFAEIVRDVELNDAGIVCGFQDAYMAVYGGLLAMDFSGKHPVRGGPLGRVERLRAELPFLLVTTGIERLSGSVHGPIRERWLSGEPDAVEAIERLAKLGRAGAQALAAGDWLTLGRAMDENHEIAVRLGGSGEPIDDLVARCKEAGAMSAKLAGAGLGGTVIALCEDPNALEEKLRQAGYESFLRPSIEPGLRSKGNSKPQMT